MSAPSAQSIRAVDRPIPRLAPVTTQARPLRSRSTLDELEVVFDAHVLRRERAVDGALAGDDEVRLGWSSSARYLAPMLT